MRGEHYHGQRAGWLRPAVLGADDGIVSAASLSIGVAASGAPRSAVTAAAVAALVAGAMSMAAGEYVSVGSQRDTERGDLDRERVELAEEFRRRRAGAIVGSGADVGSKPRCRCHSGVDDRAGLPRCRRGTSGWCQPQASGGASWNVGKCRHCCDRTRRPPLPQHSLIADVLRPSTTGHCSRLRSTRSSTSAGS